MPAAWLLACGAAAPAAARDTDGELDADFAQVVAAGDYHYARSRRAGVFLSRDGGRTWQPRSAGLPHRVVHPFPQPPEYRHLTSLGVDPRDPRRVAATTARGVYLSEDAGASWHAIPVGEPIRDVAYFTSVAPSPHDADALLLGTSFNGIYETGDRGATWQYLTLPSDALVFDTDYIEEAAALSYDPGAAAAVAVLAGFDGGVYYHPDRRAPAAAEGAGQWRRYPVPEAATTHLSFARQGADWVLQAGHGAARWRLTEAGAWAPAPRAPAAAQGRTRPRASGTPGAGAGAAAPPAAAAAPARPRAARSGIPMAPPPPGSLPAALGPEPEPAPPERAPRANSGAGQPRAEAGQRSGIYLSAGSAAARLPEFLEFLRHHGLNSFVVDLKDDLGYLTYDSAVPLAHEMGAVRPWIKVDELVAQAHAAGIYVIARLVVFKDRFLYGWQDHRLAVWDRERDAPWRHLIETASGGEDNADADAGGAGEADAEGESEEPTFEQREFWVDPFAAEVWEYNAAVAAELAARGVDEIQFDYIRFPSDGPVRLAGYRHRRPGMSRGDAIESFLAVARERVQVPIGTDLFGYNSWYRSGNWIGQNIEVLSEYVDVISPMYYPSHFPRRFLPHHGYLERARVIYERGVRRAQRLVQGRSYVRPYVQAFLIGGELNMNEQEYGRYLAQQLAGSRKGGASGFTLWNASNRYYMVTEPLQPYLR